MIIKIENMPTKAKKYIANQQEKGFPHVGQMVEAVLKKKKWYSAALARDMGRSLNSIMNYYKAQSMQTSILWELSLNMKHNFFADIALQLPADFAKANNDAMDAKDAEIAALKKAVEKLQGEKDLLMEVMRK